MAQKSSNPPPPHHEDGLPPSLQADLQALYGQTPTVPAGLDAQIATLARQHFAARRKRQIRFWLGIGTTSAAAAGLLLAALLTLKPVEYQRRGDILDAFYLARQLKAGSPVARQWDINGDGLINAQDVDTLAASAVAIQHPNPRTGKAGGTI